MIGDDTNMIYLAVVLGVLLLVVALGGWLAKLRFAKPDVKKFTERWNEAQKLCSSKNTWPLAIINADKLLDDALKRSHYKGKTMGERLVAAQRTLSDNDSVWYAHKLRNKIVHEDYGDLKKRDVQKVLVGFRQALRDLGALR
ncbi:hypothetical protein BH09PAT4_BH09PAT4_07080 [soil metagenome]